LGECLAALDHHSEAESLLVSGSTRLLSESEYPRREKARILDSMIGFYEASGRPERAEEFRQQKKELEAEQSAAS